jgi:predicted Zn-dependent peptidase
MRIGLFESAADWRLLNAYVEGVRKVTSADILEVAMKYLQLHQRTVGTLIPIEKKKP